MRWFQRRINKAATDERIQFYTYKAGYYAFNWMMIVILITALIAGYLKEDAGIIGMIGMWLAWFGGMAIFMYNTSKQCVDVAVDEIIAKNLSERKDSRRLLLFMVFVLLFVPFIFQYVTTVYFEKEVWNLADGIWESLTFTVIMTMTFWKKIEGIIQKKNQRAKDAEMVTPEMSLQESKKEKMKLMYMDSLNYPALFFLISASVPLKSRIFDGYIDSEYNWLMVFVPLLLSLMLYILIVAWRMMQLRRGTIVWEKFLQLSQKMYTARIYIYSSIIGIGTASCVSILVSDNERCFSIMIISFIAVSSITRQVIMVVCGKTPPVVETMR